MYCSESFETKQNSLELLAYYIQVYSINDVDNVDDGDDSEADENDDAVAEDEGDEDNKDEDEEDFSGIFEGMRCLLSGISGYPVFLNQYPATYPVYRIFKAGNMLPCRTVRLSIKIIIKN